MKMVETKLIKPIPPEEVKAASTLAKRIWLFIGIVLTLLLVWVGSIYATTPNAIRNPKFEHYHFRMQVIVNGQAENFGQDKYQAQYSADNCNVELTKRPIHFHDNKDQFVHIHWDDMSGGMVLKNYGWNFIGGSDQTLGYRFDDLVGIKNVSTHSNSLPGIPRGSNYYVFMGDEISFVERGFDQFKNQDLETFFGKKSNLSTDEHQSFWDTLFPKAFAHSAENHSEPQTPEEINNLIGNVVIFVQSERPKYEQVKDRFNQLQPLSTSSCAG